MTNLPVHDKEAKAIRIASNLLKTSFPVKEVILFGSKARGDDDRESDIDLLVLTTVNVTYSLRKRIIDALFDIERQFDVALSPLIVFRDEWEKGPLSALLIYDAVKEEGVAV